MKLSLRSFTIISFLLFSPALYSQAERSFEIGLSYRYISLADYGIGLTHVRSEQVGPHELDINSRFYIGDPRIRGTLTIGFARFGYAYVQYPNFWIPACDVEEYTAITQNYLAYRFNPGAEYSTTREKISYGFGAGAFYYGTFKGEEERALIREYMHTDSVSQSCVTDSTSITISSTKAPVRAVIALGLSAHCFLGYEIAPGLTLFGQFAVNPGYTFTERNWYWSPSGSAGFYYRFSKPVKTVGRI